jgi:hypothetical protein
MADEFLKRIYLDMIRQSVMRLNAAQRFLREHASGGHVAELEAAALQVRKAFECIAYSAIAPDKEAYASLRAAAVASADFTKDYHAERIFKALAEINFNFYPKPVVLSSRSTENNFHLEGKERGFLTQKRFGVVYDRLGKHLHADNPWRGDKNTRALASDLPSIIAESFELLELHVRYIRTPQFHGAWVVHAPRTGATAVVVAGEANGPFTVNKG